MRNVKRYVIPTIFVLVVAGMGTLFTNSGMEWFDTLKRPSEWLPDFVIPIVWTIIYLSFWIFTITNDYYLYPRLTNLLIVNGFINVLWCLIYFVINSLLGGLIVIILNLVTSILLLIEISKYYKTWSMFLLIYPTWLLIATTLNLTIFVLN